MVNFTTASLEPAPLSSGWKSGSLPTGFTPTILTESPAGRPRRFRLQNLTRKAQERLREAGAWSGAATTTCPPGALSAESRQGADESRGRRRGLGGEREEARREAPSSHRAEGASALARLTSYPRLAFASPPEASATAEWRRRSLWSSWPL